MLGAIIGGIISAFVVIVVGFTLVPVIQEQIIQINQNSSFNQASLTILNLLPIGFAISILIIVISVVAQTLRGFSEYSEEYEEENKDIPIQNKPHKQTYLEYVKERLEVERLMRRSRWRIFN